MPQLQFSTGTVNYLLPGSFSELETLVNANNCILISDQHVADAYPALFDKYKNIILQPGEEQKSWDTITYVIQELINFKANKKTFLVGMGGGVITDITGFVGSIYMRGMPFGYIPTTLLGMVDASIGGKNGVNAGLYKNLLGTINQPKFILFDTHFLGTLPEQEWSNGFAEIIKYACLFDSALFDELCQNDIAHYKNNTEILQQLITTCVNWKNKVVQEDETESGNRKLLNFGHTAGHAFENTYHLPHGCAVALGIVVACKISEGIAGFKNIQTEKVIELLQQYGLPVTLSFETEKIINILKMDKKRNNTDIDYIVLEDIGKGAIKPVTFNLIEQSLIQFAHAGNY